MTRQLKELGAFGSRQPKRISQVMGYFSGSAATPCLKFPHRIRRTVGELSYFFLRKIKRPPPFLEPLAQRSRLLHLGLSHKKPTTHRFRSTYSLFTYCNASRPLRAYSLLPVIPLSAARSTPLRHFRHMINVELICYSYEQIAKQFLSAIGLI
jgi:hypothetical protein